MKPFDTRADFFFSSLETFDDIDVVISFHSPLHPDGKENAENRYMIEDEHKITIILLLSYQSIKAVE